eukprot:1459365-Pyramimonas_sp.AAC.1
MVPRILTLGGSTERSNSEGRGMQRSISHVQCCITASPDFDAVIWDRICGWYPRCEGVDMKCSQMARRHIHRGDERVSKGRSREDAHCGHANNLKSLP